ncbi:MAG: acyclic terpene utilization AtuA family protein [Maricaulaceae bacterium]
MNKDKIIKIGGASGYWGESAMATPQLLAAGGLDYLVYDYLAEITMSIMARAKAKDSSRGYATDFIDFMLKPNLRKIAKSGVKIIANAGGVNPESCGAAARALIAEQGLDLKVAVITGDNLLADKDAIAASGKTDMFSGAAMPDASKIASINAYLGAFPIAKALAAGADIVITGRVVDSAVTLGACIHEFGWGESDWDLLASGSLAGHILECGPQTTGGNFTDWEDVGDIANIGYPIAEISADGSFITTKPEGTGGIVTVGTVSEQMLYEIGDPQSYLLPDVTCDFSEVTITQDALDRVLVSPAKGRPAPSHYKTCLTYADGFRAGTYVTLYGGNATAKAEKLADAVMVRTANMLRLFNLGEYTEVSREILGSGSQFGEARASDEVVMKFAVKHPEAMGIGLFLKELAGMGLATPPGLSGFTGGGRARPQPVVRLFSYLTDKTNISSSIEINGTVISHTDFVPDQIAAPTQHIAPNTPDEAVTEVPLETLAWARSGDKGNKANIGVIARKAEYLPYIWASLTPQRIGDIFAHFADDSNAVQGFYLPGSNSINYLIDNVLGGGGAASLRNDAQAKGYGQILLSHTVKIPAAMAAKIT